MASNRNYILHPSYTAQQEVLDKIGEMLGVKVYRPDYHAAKDDKNTVLFYIPEEYECAVEMEKQGCDQLSKDYPRCFWFFENSDINGNFSLDFANNGKIDMRGGIDWIEQLKNHIEYAMICRQQNIYLGGSGGVLELREGDDIYNDLNRSIIQAFWKMHGTAFIGNINYYDKDREKVVAYEKSVFTAYNGEKVLNFGAAFIIPKADNTLDEMIRRWNTPGEQTMVNIEAITQRIERLGGKHLIWY